MRYAIYSVFFVLLLFSVGCQNEPSESKEVQNPAPSEVEEPKLVPAGEFLPSVPIEKLEYLWANCDYVDYVFFELPISMSLDQKKFYSVCIESYR